MDPSAVSFAEPTPRARMLGLAAVIAASFGIGLFLGSLTPLASLFLESQGVSARLIGLNGAMPSLAVLIAGPFLPRFVRRVGSARAMLAGLALGAAAVLAMPVWPNLWAWFALRFVMGFALALPWLISEAWINMAAPESRRARIIGLYSAVLFAGMALGPLLIQATGTDSVIGFAVSAGALALAALPLIAARRLAPGLPAASGLRLGGVVRMAPAVAAAGLLGGASEMAFFALLPVYGLRAGLSPDAALMLLTVLMIGAIVLQVPLGWLADRVDRHRLLLGMALAGAVATPLLGVVVTTPWLAWPLIFGLGGLVLGYYTVGLTLLGARFRGGELAVANAAILMLYEGGAALGPALAGTAMDLWPPHGYLLFFSLGALAYVGVALVDRGAGRGAGRETGRGTGKERSP